MKQDDVIRLAKEAGFSDWALQTPNDFLVFAKLVAAKAKEQEYADLIRIIEANILEEREACAKVAETLHKTSWPDTIASVIRARGQA